MSGGTEPEQELKDGDIGVEIPFYTDGAKYWEGIEPTVDGMLGGLGFLTDTDIKTSERFLKNLWKVATCPGKTYALDCGAGIGRITKNLLSRYFDKVDLVDQCHKFVDQAKVTLEGNPKVGEFYCSGLQRFIPTPNKYDIIWIQWVLPHLTDEDLIALLRRCREALRTNGMIVLKENCTRDEEVQYDNEDSSVTRPVSLFNQLFAAADFKVFRHSKQKNFPNELFPVWMFALTPK